MWCLVISVRFLGFLSIWNAWRLDFSCGREEAFFLSFFEDGGNIVLLRLVGNQMVFSPLFDLLNGWFDSFGPNWGNRSLIPLADYRVLAESLDIYVDVFYFLRLPFGNFRVWIGVDFASPERILNCISIMDIEKKVDELTERTSVVQSNIFDIC